MTLREARGRVPETTAPAAYRPCPTPNGFTGASCKRRGCPVCGVPWAKSVGAVSEHALEHFLSRIEGSVVLIAITPPGADVLPWACKKNHRTRDGRPLPHSGTRGCRVDDEAADAWAATLTERWKKLRDAARKAVERAGLPAHALVLERVYEPQKRGVPHLHVVAGARTPLEYAAANRFAVELHRLAEQHGFGNVDRGKREPNQACPVRAHKGATHAALESCRCAWAHPKFSAAEARRYLVNYLTGRSKKKGSIRDNIQDPRMPRSLWWVTPALTSLSTNERIESMREKLGGVVGGTGVTMRRLRYVRWYFAALAGRCTVLPRLFGQDVLDVARVAAQLEPQKARAPGETDEARARRHLKNLMTMRQLQEPWNLGAPRGRTRKYELADEPAVEVERDPWTQLAFDTLAAWRAGTLTTATAAA